MRSHSGHTLIGRVFSLTALILFLLSSGHSQGKEIIGYFPSWKWRVETNAMTLEKIPYDKLTIINYAFFYPRPDGTITGRDSTGDALYLGGKPGTRLTDLAHRKNVKVLLSLGGWEDSNNFPMVAADSTRRTAFAHACVDAMRRFGFDGIDIDWEYPGYTDHNGTPADKENYTLLLQALRDSLRAYGSRNGEAPLLTAAFSATAPNAAFIDFPKIAGILDLFNIMTYDFYGPWEPLCNHNSPLYPSAGADSTRCVDAAFRLYNTTFGIPASRINLGLPFYGQTYTGCTKLNSPHTGSDTTHFSKAGAYYADIVRQKKNFTRTWDTMAQVPYLVSSSWNELVSYDDEESIRIKAQYMLSKNVHGCIIWEITGDYLPDGTTPLLNAVATTFSSPQSRIH